MANSRIPDLTNYTTPDGTNDTIPIWDNANSQTKKITRNNYLGITGSPVGTTDSQALTNKTINQTNTITQSDSVFIIQNLADATKKAKFDVSGVTTSTTRTYTLPNASGTLVDLASSQTLTNKTLTSPVITGGSIDNTTITVDAITGHSSANTGTIYGVAVTSAAFSGNNIVPNNSLSNTGSFGSAWSWTSWVPTWTNLVVSGSTVTAKYAQVGKVIHYRIAVVLAGGNAPTGSVTFTLPITSVSYAGTATLPVVGSAQYFISSGFIGYAVWSTTTTATLVVFNASATYLTAVSLSGTVPASFTNGSEIHAEGFYEAA